MTNQTSKKRGKLVRCFCGNRFRQKKRKQIFCSSVCERVYSPVNIRDVAVRTNRINVPWTVVFDPDEEGYPIGSILNDVDMTLNYGWFNVGTVLTRMGKICVVIRPDESNCEQELIDISRVVYQDLVICNAITIREVLRDHTSSYRTMYKEGVWAASAA